MAASLIEGRRAASTAARDDVAPREGSIIMLVLTRKVNKELVIGDDVVVTVLSIQGNTVRLGITAPREIPVQRGELRGRTARMIEVEVELPESMRRAPG
jgi:carbon storage regulator